MDDKIKKHREFLAKFGEPREEKAITFVIDEWWNTPLWNGKNADGVHQCPKGPRDATNWAWICHRPSVWKERWRVIPWGTFWAIRYEPVDWECLWVIVEIHMTLEDARAAAHKY